MGIKDTLAGEFERGKPWNPRKNPDDPNPLYGEVVKWSRGTTAHGEADFLPVRDDEDELWSILVGTFKLRKDLLEGEICEWDESRDTYAVIDTIGPVQPGELLAIQFRGEREFTNNEGRRVTNPDYRTLRKRSEAATTSAQPVASGQTDDRPF